MSKITVQALVSAPIEKVWRCWTEPHHIMQWNFAHESWHCPASTNDLRVGGKFLSTMAAKDGSMSFDFEGVYDSIEVNKKIAYRIADGRVVEVLFESDGDNTVVTETFDAESVNPVEMQEAGWQSILNHFKEYTERVH